MQTFAGLLLVFGFASILINGHFFSFFREKLLTSDGSPNSTFKSILYLGWNCYMCVGFWCGLLVSYFIVPIYSWKLGKLNYFLDAVMCAGFCLFLSFFSTDEILEG